MCEQSVLKVFPWINANFVQNIVENSEVAKNVTLKSFGVKMVFINGESFSSHMIALRVFFKNKTTSVEKQKDFLMKIALQTEEYQKLCKECQVYEREIEGYTKILPCIEKCFDSVGITCKIAPRCFFTDIERRVLVFEDLRDHGFKNVDKMCGLDYEHMKLSLVSLAKWHAGTASLLTMNPEIFDWYMKIIDYKKAGVLVFFRSVAKNVSKAVENWIGYRGISEKITKKMNDVSRSEKPLENGFNVITHGDTFMNNFLFRHDQNGKPLDVRIVDFAHGRYTSPEKDLACLIYGSASSSIDQRDRENLIKYYHSALTKYLKLLKYPGTFPTLFDMQLMIFRIDFFNALMSLFIVGARFVNTSYEGGFFELLKDDKNDGNGSEKMYTHPKCIEQVQYLLDLFDRRGCFDS